MTSDSKDMSYRRARQGTASVMFNGSANTSSMGRGGLEVLDRAEEKKRQDALRSKRYRDKKRKRSLEDFNAAARTLATFPALCTSVPTNPTPSACVHAYGAAVVAGIVNPESFKWSWKDRVREFEAWAREIGKRDGGSALEGLFGKKLWVKSKTAYQDSAASSNRYSAQLLPVCNGPTEAAAPWMRELEEHVFGVLCRLGILGKQHNLGGMTLLLSAPNACQQSWHTDYKWWEPVFKRKHLESNGTVPYPVSVLIGLHEQGAELPLQRGQVVKFGQYSAVVFRGDLEHAGAAWLRRRGYNWRIHLYYDTVVEGSAWKTSVVPKEGRARGNQRHVTVIPTSSQTRPRGTTRPRPY